MPRHPILLLLTALLLLPLAMCRAVQEAVPSGETAQVSRALGVDASAGTVVSASDSHGGFHGDGLTFIELSFQDETFGNSVRGSWKPLPLSSNLQTFVYGASTAGPSVTRDGVNLFPPVQNGYYCFRDRHSESTDPQDDASLFQRHSFHVTIALYDSDAKTLYYCKFDT